MIFLGSIYYIILLNLLFPSVKHFGTKVGIWKIKLLESSSINFKDKGIRENKEETMLETIIVILLVLWLIGVVGFSGTVGNLIHLLLVIALVVFVIRLLTGRRVV